MNKLFLTFLLAGATAFSCSSHKERLVVASEQADCVGVGPQKCLLVRHEGEHNWEFWYDGIQGFSYEPGYEYVLKVRKEQTDGRMADRSSVHYVLDKVVSKTPKTSEHLPIRADELVPVSNYYEEDIFIIPVDSLPDDVW